ncbi:hypothetical protein JXA80_06195 [bacterium]|nr:hypothetical protein [candidate division CSSED10-310 bacterium]
MSNTENGEMLLSGAWKLEYYETSDGDRFTHFSDILLFSYPYYSDLHTEFGMIKRTFGHVGKFKLSGDTITFQVQQSTESEYIGLVAVGRYHLASDTLEIIMERGNTPGTWVYKRLN